MANPSQDNGQAGQANGLARFLMIRPAIRESDIVRNAVHESVKMFDKLMDLIGGCREERFPPVQSSAESSERELLCQAYA